MNHSRRTDENFYGCATVGERGQVVVPAEARCELGIKPGDKLLIMKHPFYNVLMIAKLEAMGGFLGEFLCEDARVCGSLSDMEDLE